MKETIITYFTHLNTTYRISVIPIFDKPCLLKLEIWTPGFWRDYWKPVFFNHISAMRDIMKIVDSYK